jgi:putative hemolysin
MSSDIGEWPIYLLIVILMLINFCVSASKRALDSVDRNKIKEMHDDDPGNSGIARVLWLIKKPSKYHYADLVLNYIIVTAIMILSILVICRDMETLKAVCVTVVIVLVYIIIADIFPKKLAANNSESYAIRYSGFQQFIYYITLPFVKVCVLIANFLLLILRKDTDVDDTYFSEDKVMSMLDEGQATGDIKEEGRKMIDSIFEFDDLLAYEIMTPRTDVFMIDITDDKEEYIDTLMEMRYSRIPVCDGDADNVIGILILKDYLLRAAKDGYDNVNIKDIMRDAYFVPETKNIDSLFFELQREKQHIAILIDEYGGFSGIVSIEDIIEQIVGDIDDEFDEDDRIIEKISDTRYIVDGNVYLDDLDEETGVELESETSETIGGFLIDLMGEIPKEGVTYPEITFENYSFRILSVKDRRIEKVEINITETDNTTEKEEV